MKIENLIKANQFLIEDYKNLKEENKNLKEENKNLKEELYNKKRKFENKEENKEENNKKQKIENYLIGSSVEYLICKIYNKFNNDYEKIFNKKNIDEIFVEENIKLFQKLKDYYKSLVYIGNSNHKFDFKVDSLEEIYISVKSNFNGKKVCPQVIGQTTLNKYKKYFDLSNLFNIENVKMYIINHIDSVLHKYLINTFHCDIIYFCYHKRTLSKKKDKNVLQIIKYNPHILHTFLFDKNNISFSHIKNNKDWNESTTVYYTLNNEIVSIGEFQIHNHRDNIKFRWNFDKIIELCGFEIIEV